MSDRYVITKTVDGERLYVCTQVRSIVRDDLSWYWTGYLKSAHRFRGKESARDFMDNSISKWQRVGRCRIMSLDEASVLAVMES